VAAVGKIGAQPGEGGMGGVVRQIKPTPDHQPDPGVRRALVGADDPGERVAVGDAERCQPEQRRLGEQLLDMRGAAQEGIVAGDVQLGVGGHAGSLAGRRV